MSEIPRFKVPDVHRLLGIPRERLKDWISLGHVDSSIQAADGPGIHHIFSLHDMCELWLYDRLRAVGFERRLIGEVLNTFRRIDDA